MEQPKSPEEPFLDGTALEDLDGAPLDIALDVKPVLPVEDLDGEDLTEDLDGLPCKSLSLWNEYWDCLSVNRRFPEITGKDNLTVFSYSGRVKSPEWRWQLRRADLRQF